MKRRTALASLTGAGFTLPLAGCAAPLDDRLRDEVVEEGNGETHVAFANGDSEVATMSYVLGNNHDGRVRFMTSLAHDLDAVRSFRLRFRPHTSAGQVPPRVLLERPGGYPFPSFRFQADRDHGWTVFEVPDLETQAPGTFSVKFWFGGVDPEEGLTVTTDLRAELDPGLDPRTFVAEAFTEVQGPTPDG